MNKRLFTLAVLALVLVGATSAWAQGGQVTVGTVEVTVEDATGAVIPGAKVTLTSPRGTLTAETDERGVATFAGVSPGLWTARVEATNFKAAEVKNLDVRIAVRTPVVVRMEPGAITETVEVTGAAIAVDTTATNLTASHDERLYQTIPLGRNLTNTFYLGVGVNDGGGTGFSNPSISGGSGLENLYVLDGVNITNTGFGAYGTYHRVFGPVGSGITTSFIQEVQVTTGGIEANYGQALGGIINVTTRSGGNNFFGAVFGYWTPNSLSPDPPQPNDFKTNLATETHGEAVLDFGVEAGGYFVKDRLFWFGSFNPVVRHVLLSAPEGADGAPFAYSDGCVSAPGITCHRLGRIDSRRRTINYAAKVSAKIDSAQNHSVEASWFGDPTIWQFGPTAGAARGEGGRGLTGSPTIVNGVVTPRDFSRLDFSGLNWNVRYNGAITPKWVVNAHIAQAHNRFFEERFFDDYGITDRSGSASGSIAPIGRGGIGFFENYKADTKQFYASSLHQFNLIGAHELTLGFQFERAKWDVLAERSGPDYPLPNDPILAAEGLVGLPQFGGTGTARGCLEFTGDAGCFLGLPVLPRAGGLAPSAIFFQISRGAYAGNLVNTETDYTSLYASDTWSITKRINLKLGLRWEQENIKGVPGIEPTDHYVFTGNWAPRLGVVVDPLGNRKAKAYFSYGRIFERIPLDLAQRSFGGEASFITQIWAATALNAFTSEPIFDPFGGSIYIPSNSSSPCNNGQSAVLCGDDPTLPGIAPDRRAAGNPFLTGNIGTLMAPGTKMQFLDEWLVGYEHELSHGIVVKARYLDRRIKRIVEDVSGLSTEASNQGGTGPDLVYGTADDTAFEQQYVITSVTAATDVIINIVCNNPAESVFDGCVLSGFSSANPDAGLAGSDGLADGFPNPVR
ncbi:MAG: TonB-dependent receptor, partial [Candidatus Acidiferrales bacterium]